MWFWETSAITEIAGAAFETGFCYTLGSWVWGFSLGNSLVNLGLTVELDLTGAWGAAICSSLSSGPW
jgi:hypothetical protein